MDDCINVLLLLSNGFELYEASCFTDVVGSFGCPQVKVVSAGLRPKLRSAFGMVVEPDAQLDDLNLDGFSALAIPGGVARSGFYEDAYSTKFMSAIIHFAQTDKPIASICAGSLPVARSGVLRGRKATTYHLSARMRAELSHYGVDVVDDHLVIDGKFISSSSPATGVDVALTLLQMLTSTDNYRRIRHTLGFDTYQGTIDMR